MHTVSGAPPTRGSRFPAAVFAAGALVFGACNQPQDANPPQDDMPAMEALVVPETGLVGEWKLDGNGVDSKNGYNATVFGGATFVASNLGSAINLNNGTSGTGGKYAEMPSNAALDTVQEGNYSVSAWFYPYSIPPDTTLDNRFWAIVIKAGQHLGLAYNNFGKFSMRHYMTGPQLQQAQDPASYPANTWHHVVGTVNKATGKVKVYVNGNFGGEGNFTPGTAALEYGTTRFRIGRAGSQWAANGRVDQVRIYNRELTSADVTELFNESSTFFRFPVGMTKGNQYNLIGQNPTPDGLETAARNPTDVVRALDAAQSAGARIALRVTPDNTQLGLNTDPKKFDINKWKAGFDAAVAGTDPRPYLRNGTLVGLYAIDEPFPDFPNNMSGGLLEQICQHAKNTLNWGSVPCLIRELNTRLYAHRPAGGYQYVDAGWTQMADHQWRGGSAAYPYSGIRAYFDSNLVQGRRANLALVYGFNLINGGTGDAGCIQLEGDNPNRCAMTAAEVTEVTTILEAIETEAAEPQGCGVNGWRIDPDLESAARDYYDSQGAYAGNGIQNALQNMQTRLFRIRPMQVCSLHNLPAP